MIEPISPHSCSLVLHDWLAERDAYCSKQMYGDSISQRELLVHVYYQISAFH